MARHFFIPPSNIVEDLVIFTEDDLRHFQSLRIRPGDSLQAVVEDDSPNKTIYTIKIEGDKKRIVGRITAKGEEILEYKKKIHLMQCIPKLDKMDLIIQKSAELGAFEIIPLLSRYTDVQGKIGEQKLSRWQKIAREASIQSGRLDIISIQKPKALLDSIKLPEDSFGLIAAEMEQDHTLRDFEEKIKSDDVNDIYVYIGAEGGFSNEEVTILSESGIRPFSLGKNILRTETAPIATVAILQYILSY